MLENKPAIIVRRHLYEEPHCIDLEFVVSNGYFSGRIENIYCAPKELSEIGEFLINFPQKYPDEYCYEFGSENKDKFDRYFKMRIYTHSISAGAIYFSIMTDNDWEERICKCSFPILCIPLESLRKLGEIFIIFSELKHSEFHWFPDGSYELFDNLT